MQIDNLKLKMTLGFINQIINPRHTLPILQMSRWESDGKKLTIRSSNLAITQEANIDVDEPLKPICINSILLLDVIRNIDSMFIDISFDNGVVVTDGKDKYKIEYTDEAKAFTPMPKVKGTTVVFQADKFKYLLNKSSIFTLPANDTTRPQLSCIEFKIESGMMCISASDNVRIFNINMPTKIEDIYFKVGSATAKFLTKLGSEDIAIQSDGNNNVYSQGDYIIIEKCIEQKFPNVKPVVDKAEKNPYVLTVAKNDILIALKKVLLFGFIVRLDIKADSLNIKCVDTERNRASDVTIKCEATANESILLNGNLLKEVLGIFDVESIEIKYIDQTNAIFVKPAGKKGAGVIVSLMKV